MDAESVTVDENHSPPHPHTPLHPLKVLTFLLGKQLVVIVSAVQHISPLTPQKKSSPGSSTALEHPLPMLSLNQLLALTTEDGNFFMGALSKNSCWLRNIAVTERGQGSAKTEVVSTAAPAVTAPSDHEPKRDHSDLDAKQISRGWGWRLLGTGRHAVAAAATAAATDAVTASTSAPSSLSGRRNGPNGIIETSPPGAADAVAGAVCVEFSPKGLMAVGIADGTVLLTRVERYTTGLRCGDIESEFLGGKIYLSLRIRERLEREVGIDCLDGLSNANCQYLIDSYPPSPLDRLV